MTIEKKVFSVQLPVELIKEVKDTTYWTAGVTLSSFCEAALQDALNNMKHQGPDKYYSKTEHGNS